MGQPLWVGHYDQTWYVGSESTSPLSFDVFSSPYVRGTDTDNPSISPNFGVGDSYVYEVFGAPNQPVSLVTNTSPLVQFGQTDGNGEFVYSQIGVANWIGQYTQAWYVGGQATNVLTFTVSPGVRLANLTHPNIAPNFFTGDTYQYTVSAQPNQPVYVVQNAAIQRYFGNTDANGTLVITGSDQSGSQGSYTQVWSVGGQQASPAFSFVVGDTNAGGTLISTFVGATPDSSIIGVSSVSISNGTATT